MVNIYAIIFFALQRDFLSTYAQVDSNYDCREVIPPGVALKDFECGAPGKLPIIM